MSSPHKQRSDSKTSCSTLQRESFLDVNKILAHIGSSAKYGSPEKSSKVQNMMLKSSLQSLSKWDDLDYSLEVDSTMDLKSYRTFSKSNMSLSSMNRTPVKTFYTTHAPRELVSFLYKLGHETKEQTNSTKLKYLPDDIKVPDPVTWDHSVGSETFLESVKHLKGIHNRARSSQLNQNKDFTTLGSSWIGMLYSESLPNLPFTPSLDIPLKKDDIISNIDVLIGDDEFKEKSSQSLILLDGGVKKEKSSSEESSIEEDSDDDEFGYIKGLICSPVIPEGAATVKTKNNSPMIVPTGYSDYLSESKEDRPIRSRGLARGNWEIKGIRSRSLARGNEEPYGRESLPTQRDLQQQTLTVPEGQRKRSSSLDFAFSEANEASRIKVSCFNSPHDVKEFLLPWNKEVDVDQNFFMRIMKMRLNCGRSSKIMSNSRLRGIGKRDEQLRQKLTRVHWMPKSKLPKKLLLPPQKTISSGMSYDRVLEETTWSETS